MSRFAWHSTLSSRTTLPASANLPILPSQHRTRCWHDSMFLGALLQPRDGYAAISAVPEARTRARGFLSRPSNASYSAAAVHARDGWKLFVRGYSKYVYAREIWSRTSSRYCAFGLFRSFGALELCFSSACDAGVNNGMDIENGFDYTRWNGATAVHIPLTQLAAAPDIVEDEWAECYIPTKDLPVDWMCRKTEYSHCGFTGRKSTLWGSSGRPKAIIFWRQCALPRQRHRKRFRLMGNRDHAFSGAGRPRRTQWLHRGRQPGVRILYLSWAASAFFLPAVRYRAIHVTRGILSAGALLPCCATANVPGTPLMRT